MKLMLITAVAGFVVSPHLATAQYSYMKSLETGETIGIIDQLIKVFETNDNNLVVYGDYIDPAVKTSFDIVKIDTAANPIWSTRISRTILPNDDLEEFKDIIQLPDSGYALAGLYHYTNNTTIGYMRLDKDGQPLTIREINGFTNSIKASQVMLFNDTTLLFSVERYSSVLQQPVAGHIFTDLNALVKSSQFYYYGNNSHGGIMDLTSDGGFINAFQVYSYPAGSFRSTLGLAKFDAAGVLQWDIHYITMTGNVEIYDIKQLPNGCYAACGMLSAPNGGSLSEGLVMYFSNTGTLLWAKKHVLYSNFFYRTITLIGNDSISLAGSAFVPATWQLVSVVDTSGALLGTTGFLYSQPWVLSESCLTHDNKLITLTVTGWTGVIDKKIITKSDAGYLNLCNSALLPFTDASVPFYDSLMIGYMPETFYTTNGLSTYTYDYSLPQLQVMCTATELAEIALHLSVQVYPNPCSNFVNISLPYRENTIVSVFDLMGKVLIAKTFTDEKQLQLPLTNLAKGIYMLNVKTEEKNYSQKLMVN